MRSLPETWIVCWVVLNEALSEGAAKQYRPATTRLLAGLTQAATVKAVVMTRPSDHDLQDLTDRTRARTAVEGRRRRRSLLQQAGEEGTFRGVLADLAERRAPVTLHTLAGRVLDGTISTLASDFVGLTGRRGDTSLVPLGCLTGVRAEPGSRSTTGDRPSGRLGESLGSALVTLAAERPRVVVHTLAGDRFVGRLWSAGQDVVVVRSGAGEPTYIRSDAVNDLTFA